MSTLPPNRFLLLGTRNSGKLREIVSILGKVPWSICSLQEFKEIGTAAETGKTYSENAIAKAQFYASATGLCALADDSGLEVEALGSAPGVLSARYAGDDASDEDRRRLLLAELSKVTSNRRARFVCVVAIATPSGAVMNISEGVCSGTIAFEPRGVSGFGYDPLFVPDDYELTFAELSESIKNRISHRGRALIGTRDFLISEEAQLDR